MNNAPVDDPDFDTVSEGILRPLSDQSVRGWLALAFAIIFGVTTITALIIVSVVSDLHWANMKELLQILIPAQTALLGSVVGFYYGTQRDS